VGLPPFPDSTEQIENKTLIKVMIRNCRSAQVRKNLIKSTRLQEQPVTNGLYGSWRQRLKSFLGFLFSVVFDDRFSFLSMLE
jgi:hypothetical protein